MLFPCTREKGALKRKGLKRELSEAILRAKRSAEEFEIGRKRAEVAMARLEQVRAEMEAAQAETEVAAAREEVVRASAELRAFCSRA